MPLLGVPTPAEWIPQQGGTDTIRPRRAGSRAAALEQSNQSWLWPGVPDTPLPLRIAEAGGSPPLVPPSDGGTVAGSSPRPGGLEGAEAKTAAGTFGHDATVGLEGAEAKAEAGEFVAAEFVRPPVAQGEASGRATAQAIGTFQLTLTPTMYPPPGDTVVVEDAVSINLGSAEFREFKEAIGQVCTAIAQSNQTSREVGDKLVAELQAGLKIIEGPKPSRKLIDLFLTYPLGAAATIFAGSFVAELAKHAAGLLLKFLGAG
jgi:hypothetical protein